MENQTPHTPHTPNKPEPASGQPANSVSSANPLQLLVASANHLEHLKQNLSTISYDELEDLTRGSEKSMLGYLAMTSSLSQIAYHLSFLRIHSDTVADFYKTITTPAQPPAPRETPEPDLTPDEPTPSNPSNPHPHTHIAIVVGHTASAKGAYSEALRISEYDLWRKVANITESNPTLQSHNITLSVHLRKGKDGRKEAYREADKAIRNSISGEGFTAELHFNSVANSKPNYSRTLYWKTSKVGKAIASAIELTEPLAPSKGPLGLGSGDRGSSNLRYSAFPSVLLEPFFGSYENIRYALETGLLIDLSTTPSPTLYNALSDNLAARLLAGAEAYRHATA